MDDLRRLIALNTQRRDVAAQRLLRTQLRSLNGQVVPYGRHRVRVRLKPAQPTVCVSRDGVSCECAGAASHGLLHRVAFDDMRFPIPKILGEVLLERLRTVEVRRCDVEQIGNRADPVRVVAIESGLATLRRDALSGLVERERALPSDCKPGALLEVVSRPDRVGG